jgi:UV DNA damage endonuclease
MTLSDGVPNSKKVLTSRTLRQASFSIKKVNDIVLANCTDLLKILKWNNEHNIKFFRISSEIFPFMDHPELAYTIDQLPDANKIRIILAECGKFARDNGIRLTTHPGPYNCLGSPNEFTVKKTLLSLEMHTLLGELMGMSDFVINLHVGGSYGGDFQNTADRFISNFAKLSPNAQRWLTIENDDKPSLWTVTKLQNQHSNYR